MGLIAWRNLLLRHGKHEFYEAASVFRFTSSDRKLSLIPLRLRTRLRTGVLENEHARSYAIRRVGKTAVVERDVIDLDRRFFPPDMG